MKFVARGKDYTLFLGSSEVAIAPVGRHANLPPSPTTDGAVVMRLVNASQKPYVVGTDLLPGRTNYLIGRDPSRWLTNVPTYSRIRYEQVYDGVDLVFYGTQDRLECDFEIAPRANIQSIRVAFDGAERVEVTGEGALVLRAQAGDFSFHKPQVYQTFLDGRRDVSGAYLQLDNNNVAFRIGDYDKSRSLVIDPVISFSSFLGGQNSEDGSGIAVDVAGNTYLTGSTNSVDFPVVNPLQRNLGSTPSNVITPEDIFVTKLDASRSALIYSTYIGGSDRDLGASIAVDSEGNAYVTGWTLSIDFPIVAALQPAIGDRIFGDAFVVKLDSSGSVLIYSTYLGGSQDDRGRGIAVDTAGNAFVTGSTSSTDFPTAMALQDSLGGGGAGRSDAFVTKINPAGSAMVFSTYLGGTSTDFANGIAVDASGNAYVVGTTRSVDFPTVRPLQADLRGIADAFVAKLDAIGSSIIYSTLLGGTGSDNASAIAIDSENNAYLTGSTSSADFPTVNAYQPTRRGPDSNGRLSAVPFVIKVDATGSSLLYSTYLDVAVDASVAGIAVDSSGNAYIAGHGIFRFPPVGFPAPGPGPTDDVFIAKLNPSGTGLVDRTIMGGDDVRAGGIAIDSFRNVYITGITYGGIPTVNPLQPPFRRGHSDAFVTRISQSPVEGAVYFAMIRAGESSSTAITLSNLDRTTSADVTVVFFGADGKPMATAVDNPAVRLSVGPLQIATLSTKSQGPSQTGYARITTSRPIVAYETYTITGLPKLDDFPSAQGPLIFSSSISRRLGREISLAVVNVSDQRVRVVITLADAKGRPLRSPRMTAILAPGEQVTGTLPEILPGISQDFTGTVRIVGLSPFPSGNLVVSGLEFGPGVFNALPVKSAN